MRTKDWEIVNMNMIFPVIRWTVNTVQRATKSVFNCIIHCRRRATVRLSTIAIFWKNAREVAAEQRTHVHSFAWLYTGPLHAQFIFMLNSAFTVLHSIKFDFYSCTIKTESCEECDRRGENRERAKGGERKVVIKMHFLHKRFMSLQFCFWVHWCFVRLISCHFCLPFRSALSHSPHTHTSIRGTRRLPFSVFICLWRGKMYHTMRCDAILCNPILWFVCALDGGADWSQLPVSSIECSTQQPQHAHKINIVKWVCVVFCQWHGKRFRSLDSVVVEWTTLNSECETTTTRWTQLAVGCFGVGPRVKLIFIMWVQNTDVRTHRNRKQIFIQFSNFNFFLSKNIKTIPFAENRIIFFHRNIHKKSIMFPEPWRVRFRSPQ